MNLGQYSSFTLVTFGDFALRFVACGTYHQLTDFHFHDAGGRGCGRKD